MNYELRITNVTNRFGAKSQILSLITIIILTAVLFLNLPGQAIAQSESPTKPEMITTLVWDGLVTTPGWTELHINVRNENSDWSGEIRIHKGTDTNLIYHQTLELPAHSNKSYRIPLYTDGQAGNFKVTLQNTAGQNLRENTLRLKSNDGTDVVCAIASPHDVGSGRSWTLCDERFLLSDLTTLPDSPMAWETLDYLFLNGIATADLTPAQQHAILTWVTQGGHLIVSGGPALAQSLDGLPAELKIANPGTTQNIDGLPTDIFVTGSTNAPPLTLAEASTAFAPTTDAISLTAYQRLGRGSVTILSWDIVQAESLAWFTDTWETTYIVSNSSLLTREGYNYRRLLRVSSTKLPKLWRWLLFFPIYILLMGPGTWAIVRFLKRPVLTWIILPTWIVLGIVIIALELSGMFYTTFPLTQEIAYIDVAAPGLPAHVIQGTAIYAPRAQTLQWTNPGTPRPLAGQYKVNDNEYNLGRSYALDIYFEDDHYAANVPHSFGVMTWATEGTYTLPYISANLTLSLTHDSSTASTVPHVHGQLTSDIPLHKVTLILDSSTYPLELTDVLTPGQTMNVQATGDYSSYPAHYYYSGSESVCDLRQLQPTYVSYGMSPPVLSSSAIVNANQACYITAEMEGVPFPSEELSGGYAATSCVIYTIPCPTQTTGGFGITLRAYNDATKGGGWADTNGDVRIEYPTTEFTYIVPQFAQIRTVEHLELHITPTSWDSSPLPLNDKLSKIELWNIQTEEWEEQLLPTYESYLDLSGTDSLPYFENLASVRIRLTPRKTEGANFNLVIKVKGKW